MGTPSVNATLVYVSGNITEHDFQPISRLIGYIFGSFLILFAVLSLVGNISVIMIFRRSNSPTNSVNVLITHLSLSDVLMTVGTFPFYIAAAFSGTWPFSSIVCDVYGFVSALCSLASVNILTAIAIDRYIVLGTEGFNPGREVDTKRLYLTIAFCWTYSLAWAAAPLLGWNRYSIDVVGYTCSFDFISRRPYDAEFILAMFIGDFIIPLIIITFCYASIFGNTYHQKSTFRRGSETMGTRVFVGVNDVSGSRAMEGRIAMGCLMMVICFCIAWTPYATISLIGTYGDQSLLSPLVQAIPGVICKSSACYNPYIYAWHVSKFRRRIARFLRCKD